MTLKPRSVKVDSDLWEAATAAAASEGETLSVVIRRLLREYVTRRKTP